MNPNLTSLIAAARTEDLLRRAENARVAQSAGGVSRSAGPRHELSDALRRYLHRPSFAR